MSVIFDEYLKQELVFAKTLSNYIPPSSIKTLFEVGCCEGEDTVKLSRFFKKAKIFSFEPLPKNVELTKKHLKKYGAERVEIYQLALSDASGTAGFYVSSGTPENAQHDPEWDYGNKSSSLLEPNKNTGLYEWLEFKKKITVPTERLDNFCKENKVEGIDFLHMDVQGAELMVLSGAGKMLQKTKAIWLEVEAVALYRDQPLATEVEKFMHAQGFTCVFNTVNKITGDRLYIRNDILKTIWTTLRYTNKKHAVTKSQTADSLFNCKPRVTVLMSVYNSENYLEEAMDSILCQTFTDFEFLIINDGSKDKSLEIINSYKDPRIRIVSRENWGLTASLNQGIELAKGEYIARQDSDDVSVPNRLEKEVVFLDAHPNAGLVGSNYTITDTKGKPKVTTNVFTHPDDLKITQVTCNQFGHGSVMLRKSVLDKVGGYDSKVGYVEDYDLWTRISRVADIANFVEPLYLYKSNEEGVTLQNHDLQIQQTFAVRDKAFQHFLKHRWQYRIYRWHPTGQNYRARKAMLFRDLAYLYRINGRKLNALKMLVCSYVLEPKNRKNLRYIKHILSRTDIRHWDYEFL